MENRNKGEFSTAMRGDKSWNLKQDVQSANYKRKSTFNFNLMQL